MGASFCLLIWKKIRRAGAFLRLHIRLLSDATTGNGKMQGLPGRENTRREGKRKICEQCIGKVWWILLEKFEEVHKKVAFPLSFFAILH